MKLFFESAVQAECFLRMLVLGFAAALCLDCGGVLGRFRFAADVLLLIVLGLAALCLCAVHQTDGVRLYQLLGLALGALLYSRGIGQVVQWLVQKQNRFHGRKST